MTCKCYYLFFLAGIYNYQMPQSLVSSPKSFEVICIFFCEGIVASGNVVYLFTFISGREDETHFAVFVWFLVVKQLTTVSAPSSCARAFLLFFNCKLKSAENCFYCVCFAFLISCSGCCCNVKSDECRLCQLCTEWHSAGDTPFACIHVKYPIPKQSQTIELKQRSPSKGLLRHVLPGISNKRFQHHQVLPRQQHRDKCTK